MYSSAGRPVLLLALAAILSCGCGGDADATRAKRVALTQLDGKIQELAEFSAKAEAEGLRLGDGSQGEVEALRAKASTLRDMVDRFPLAEVQSRARSIEFDAGSLLSLRRTGVEMASRARAAGKTPSEPSPVAPVAESVEAVRESTARFQALNADVISTHEQATAELGTLSARAAEATVAGSVVSKDVALELRRIEMRLHDVHGWMESAVDMNRRSQLAPAMEQLERAKPAIDLAMRQLAAARTDLTRWQTEHERYMKLAKQARGADTEGTSPERRAAAPRAGSPAASPPAGLSLESVYQKCAPSVVVILTYDYRGRRKSLGTGFIVSSDGRIVTNFHVIEGAHSAEVVLQSGQKLPVTLLVATSPATDLAVLAIDATDVPHLSLAEGELPRVGTRVFAIGAPKGLASTLSEGIISGHRTSASGTVELLTTAPVSPGSSGGPLLLGDGTVAGVVYATVVGGQNLNLAVPVMELRGLLSQQTTPFVLESPGPQKALFAVIAYDAVANRYAISNNQLSMRDAEKAAWASAGGNSRTVMWTRDGWCAIAFGRDGGVYGVAAGATKEEASMLALRECERRTTGCYVAQVICADGDQK